MDCDWTSQWYEFMTCSKSYLLFSGLFWSGVFDCFHGHDNIDILPWHLPGRLVRPGYHWTWPEDLPPRSDVRICRSVTLSSVTLDYISPTPSPSPSEFDRVIQQIHEVWLGLMKFPLQKQKINWNYLMDETPQYITSLYILSYLFEYVYSNANLTAQLGISPAIESLSRYQKFNYIFVIVHISYISFYWFLMIISFLFLPLVLCST